MPPNEVSIALIDDNHQPENNAVLAQPSGADSKPIMALDMDETVCLTIPAVSKWHNERYGTSFTLADYYTYDWSAVWGCSLEEARKRIREFQQSEWFWDKLEPVPGAKEALDILSKHYTLHIVTAREEFVAPASYAFLSKHLPGLISQVHFANQNMTPEESSKPGVRVRTKLEILNDIGTKILVDDSLDHLRTCVVRDVTVFLMDWEGKYGWNKLKDGEELPRGGVRVKSWKEVVDALLPPPPPQSKND
ncbi:hypothetical protein HK104_006290 [Borealophlyctis nickersoniae]|nr:hypothetical protein HK104_006290 [Borealophlyctis nickersoniae]